MCTVCLRWGPTHEKISDSRCPWILAVAERIAQQCQETEHNFRVAVRSGRCSTAYTKGGTLTPEEGAE